MKEAVAKTSIDTLLNSQGNDKLLSFYGGEPFLNYKLLVSVIPYARNLAEERGKNLTISICSNGTLLDEKKARFLKKNDVKLIISMVGRKRYHDRERVFSHYRGTYDSLINKLPFLFEILGSCNVGVSLCVFPPTTNALESNFKHLVRLGFTYVNLEIIREFEPWHPGVINLFSEKFLRIVRSVVAGIKNNKFLYFNPVNWELKYRLLSKEKAGCCPSENKLEIYPSGEMAFSPFLFHCEEKERYMVGNVMEQSLRLFNWCSFGMHDMICKKCVYDYLQGYKGDPGATHAYRVYQTIAREAAGFIRSLARTNPSCRRYVDTVCKQICY